MATNEDLFNRFSYHPPKHPGIAELHNDLRIACGELAKVLNEVLPESREASLALTKLEETMFWANAAVARNS